MQPLQPSNVLQYYTSGHANTKFAAWPFCLTVCYSSLLRGKILPAMLGNQTRIICLVLYPKLVSCPGSMMLDHWIPVEPALVMRNLQFFFSNSKKIKKRTHLAQTQFLCNPLPTLSAWAALECPDPTDAWQISTLRTCGDPEICTEGQGERSPYIGQATCHQNQEILARTVRFNTPESVTTASQKLPSLC